MKSPWSWIKNWFRGQDPQQIVRFVLPYPVAGVNLTSDQILELSTVWACIDAIARAIGQCAWNVYTPVGNKKRDLLENDPLMYLLNTRPNPEISAIGFREALLFNAIPQGNAYAEICRDRAGRVAQLWPLPTDRVTPRRDRETGLLFYEYRQPDGGIVFLEAERVYHLRGPGLFGLMGDNLVARAARSMGVAAAQERYSASFFGQGANPGGVLKYPRKLDDQTFERLKNDFAEKRKGPENAHKPLILEDGMEWEATGVEPQKSQLVESRKFSVEEICRWFGVPPHKVQHLEHATFSNIEHQGLEFVADAVKPWAVRMQQEASFKLIRQDRAPWRYTEIDTRPLTVGDAKSRAEQYSILRQNGIATANECRALEGMNDLGPDGDVLLVQSNLTTMERMINPPAPPKQLGPGVMPDPEADDEEADTDEDEADTSGDEVVNVARLALTSILAGAFDRVSRRLTARRADLVRAGKTSRDVEQLMADEGVKLFAQLEQAAIEVQPFALKAIGRPVTNADLRNVLARLHSGEPPAAAVAVLVATCPQVG